MIEIWKDINGYEGYYQVSNLGMFKRLEREVVYSNGKKYKYSEKIYSGYKNKNYYMFSPSKNGKQNPKSAHVWVYETFIGPIPKGYDVHHINHNPSDNRLENLCLIENSIHAKMHLNEHFEDFRNLSVKSRSKPVIQYTVNGDFISEYKSASEAARQTGLGVSNICSVCNLRKRKNGSIIKTAGGYIWRYKETA